MPRQPASPDARATAGHPGDPHAIVALYDEHVGAVVSHLHRLCRDPELAADITAETFAAVLAGTARFPAGSPSVRAWLLTVARNKLVDAQRRGGAERRARDRLGIREPLVAHDDHDALVARIDAAGSGRLSALVDGLPPAERQAVRAVVLDELDPRAVAREHDISVPTLRRRVARGLARLGRTTPGDPS
ncbi:sigma-70 family RNA polymerase sigma factor [Patulibacter sp. NPDC049589]|uniref:RNA polymerase sigma factor n=1 Tax=Patulibacter sp. NPDC049589 TaxID=3154731 RepID=UPI00344970DB